MKSEKVFWLERKKKERRRIRRKWLNPFLKFQFPFSFFFFFVLFFSFLWTRPVCLFILQNKLVLQKPKGKRKKQKLEDQKVKYWRFLSSSAGAAAAAAAAEAAATLLSVLKEMQPHSHSLFIGTILHNNRKVLISTEIEFSIGGPLDDTSKMGSVVGQIFCFH